MTRRGDGGGFPVAADDGDGDGDGYALVVAVLAMALLAILSLTLVTASRGMLTGAGAGIAHARLVAAADAGTAIALHELALADRARRWNIDGTPHALRFDGVALAVRIEDERGKIPLDQLTDDQARAMFATLGLAGADLDVATDSFLDWLDPDDDARANGAEAAWYAPLGRRPRNGPLRSLDELGLIRGITPAMVERLRPVSTVYQSPGFGFDERYAPPFALAVMTSAANPAVIERQRQLAGERPALDLNAADQLIGRPLTIRVVARAGGGTVRRATVVELTGAAARPFIVRRVE
ncbi:MAG: general secretion pathway protein GspK [Janthinobacterium lividum]